jgi:hypothetical protein
MTAQDRELLRPEDATSLAEFQARRLAEQARIRALNSSWKDIGLICLSGLLALTAIIFWGAMAFAKGGGKWLPGVLALVVTAVFLRIFSRIELRGIRGSKRYIQLDRLSKDWQARAARGEVPQTTPGGPKVWRHQLDEANIEGT